MNLLLWRTNLRDNVWQIRRMCRSILTILERDVVAVSGHFAVITHRSLVTGEPIIMPQNLIDDGISNIPVVFDNLGGTPVPPPAGGTATASIDNPAAGTVAVGKDGMSVDFSPTQPAVDGTAANITYTDVIGGQTITVGPLAVVVSVDVTAVSGTFNTGGITTRALGT